MKKTLGLSAAERSECWNCIPETLSSIPAVTAGWICSQICSVDLFSVVLTPLLDHACKYRRLSLNGHLCKTDS